MTDEQTEAPMYEFYTGEFLGYMTVIDSSGARWSPAIDLSELNKQEQTKQSDNESGGL